MMHYMMHHEQKTNFCSYHFLFSAAQQTLDTTEMVQRGHIIQSAELRSGGLCCNKADVLQRQSMMGDTVADLSSGTSLLDGGGGVCINGGHLNNNSIDIYTYCCNRDDETEMSGPDGNLLSMHMHLSQLHSSL